MSCIHLTSGSCLLIPQIKRESDTSSSICSVAALLYISLRPSFCMRCFFLNRNNHHQNDFRQLSEPVQEVPAQLQHPPNRKPEPSPSPSCSVSRRESTATTRQAFVLKNSGFQITLSPALWRFVVEDTAASMIL